MVKQLHSGASLLVSLFIIVGDCSYIVDNLDTLIDTVTLTLKEISLHLNWCWQLDFVRNVTRIILFISLGASISCRIAILMQIISYSPLI